MTPAAARAEVVLLRGRAVAWARSYGLPAATAEDVAHDALEVLLRRSADVEDGKAVAFLRAVVLNKAREAKRLPVVEPVEQVSPAPNPEDTLVSRQMAARVQEALACVPPSRRDVVRLVSIDGRSVPDVAAAEGMPESTVRARLRDGTDDLRGELSRRRAEERRKTGGFVSWLAMWGLDVRAFRRVGSALAAVSVGGMLLFSDRVTMPVEVPRVAAAIAPVALAEDPPEPAVEAPRPEPVRAAPVRTTPVRERLRHDAGRRFRAVRFGVE